MALKRIDAENMDRITALIIGQSGIGKTSILRTIPTDEKVCVLSAESGLLSVRDLIIKHQVDAFEISSFSDLKEALDYLQKDRSAIGKYRWVFIDSLTEISARCVEAMKSKFPKESQSMKMWGEYDRILTDTIKAFRDLTNYSVVFTCLETIDIQDDCRLYGPSISGNQIKNKLTSFFDEVFYYFYRTNDVGKTERLFATSPETDFPAKDRSGKLAIYEQPNLGEIKTKILTEDEELKRLVELEEIKRKQTEQREKCVLAYFKSSIPKPQKDKYFENLKAQYGEQPGEWTPEQAQEFIQYMQKEQPKQKTEAEQVHSPEPEPEQKKPSKWMEIYNNSEQPKKEDRFAETQNIFGDDPDEWPEETLDEFICWLQKPVEPKPESTQPEPTQAEQTEFDLDKHFEVVESLGNDEWKQWQEDLKKSGLSFDEIDSALKEAKKQRAAFNKKKKEEELREKARKNEEKREKLQSKTEEQDDTAKTGAVMGDTILQLVEKALNSPQKPKFSNVVKYLQQIRVVQTQEGTLDNFEALWTIAEYYLTNNLWNLTKPSDELHALIKKCVTSDTDCDPNLVSIWMKDLSQWEQGDDFDTVLAWKASRIGGSVGHTPSSERPSHPSYSGPREAR